MAYLKKVDKAYERLGRLKEKFPFVHIYYEIHISEKAVDFMFKKIIVYSFRQVLIKIKGVIQGLDKHSGYNDTHKTTPHHL